MIDINKKYRTRDGREVRIYAVDGGGGCPVQGTIFSKELGWLLTTWSMDGCVLNDIDHPADLVEVKPRIQRTVWLALYPNEGVGFSPEVSMVKRDCLARFKVEIDVEEGHGL